MNRHTATITDFAIWLSKRQKLELDAMQVATGAEFTRHLDTYTSLSAAYGAILIFEREACSAPADGRD
ncbi:hypothetical protein CBP36_11970 [Acidovorax carolinensis]|uniref:Uncharacterized protein n=1 Tax=Acidovorax carolinensis TaxID=553814 RepID=A0A240UEL4_9BURK|nr:hypothetical protein [Acidovorax carolinensis]ART54830.1 hypothetical protein CBP35_06950 [Acidovorax carolinensis]ART59460.1 hypothetical protein CBP36_11970 [Acidovorax carolinensis]